VKSKALLLTLICIFLITVSASYASNVNDNKIGTIYKDSEKIYNMDNSLKTIEISPKDNSVNKNSSNAKILAAGDNDRSDDLSQNDIIVASQNVDEFISKNGKLPNYVTVSDYKYSLPEFMYLLAKTIEYKYEKNNDQISVKYNVKNPTKPTGVDIKGKVSQNDYYDYAKRVANFISTKNIAPNYVSTSLGNMQYQTTIYSFIEILKKKNLPISLLINVKKSSNMNKFLPKYTRTVTKPSKPINEKYNGESLEQYLQDTKNCQVNDKVIKSLAINLTSKYTTNYQKAEAIFNYVNKEVSYVFYYNTKYGAKNTISKKGGNCVDKSHLMIALCRAINIPSRYVHGTCNFISGNNYGHVWTQILVENNWIAADPSHSEYNKFGLINNWDTNSYALKGIYNEIRF
jgi:transglutaminase-like putative cysteine protease